MIESRNAVIDIKEEVHEDGKEEPEKSAQGPSKKEEYEKKKMKENGDTCSDPNEHEESEKCYHSERAEQAAEKIEFKKGDSRDEQKEEINEYEKEGDSLSGMQVEAAYLYRTYNLKAKNVNAQ